jgi:glycosyltransferase involved in cell wall biosynthesis
MQTIRMSVVLIAYRRSNTLRMVLERLSEQEIAPLLECVVVMAGEEPSDWVCPSLQALGACRVVRSERAGSAGDAKAAGVAAASAPLVVFLEDHSYPDRHWAASLLRAHDSGDYAVVGPVILNANPIGGASWGCFLVYYGQYMRARREGELRHLPANHSCYRRRLLLEYGARLPQLLEAEILLHQDLLARGYRLHQEPAARAYHLNHSRLWPTIIEYFLASRVFASERASGWRCMRRLIYGFGSPLLPVIRPLRLLAHARSAAVDPATIAKSAGTVLATFAAGAAGEMMGYLIGGGKGKRRLLKFESERDRIFSKEDLQAAEMLR